MKRPVLVLTASYGEGHNAAARALTEALNNEGGPGTARMLDVFALARPKFNAWSRRRYVALINAAPKVWGALYRASHGRRWLEASFALLRTERRELARHLAEFPPRALCATYPVYAHVLAAVGRPAGAPYYNIVTDSISLHSLWWSAGADGWFVPNEESADVLRQADIPKERTFVSGFPVSPFFARHADELQPPDLSLPAARPRVLHIVNSGTRGAEETARRLLAHEEWDVTCAIGRDSALMGRLAPLAERRARPATLLGWTEEIPRLLMTHHVVVSKAGGATTQEAVAARCPMIVSQIVPGQEEGNYELLRRRGAGALATTPAEVEQALLGAFAHGGAQLGKWRSALERLARPRAAAMIARHVLNAAPP